MKLISDEEILKAGEAFLSAYKEYDENLRNGFDTPKPNYEVFIAQAQLKADMESQPKPVEGKRQELAEYLYNFHPEYSEEGDLLWEDVDHEQSLKEADHIINLIHPSQTGEKPC